MQTDEIDEEIAYWKEGLDGSPAVRVQVIREKPVEWAGRKIAGPVEVYDELPDVETIRSDHRGGSFRCIVKRPDARGRFVYAKGGHVVVKIAGDPVVPANAPLAPSRVQRDHLRAEISRVVAALVDRRLESLEDEIRRLKRKSGP